MQIQRSASRRRRASIAALSSSYAATIIKLAPVIWYKFNETSGTTVTNYGSLSSADGTWTAGTGAVGQTDAMGANQAYLYDGADSKVTGPTSTGINNLNKFTYACLVNFSSAGESNLGFVCTDAGNRGIFIVSATTPFRLTVNVWCSTGAASASTALGSGIIANDEMWVFATYDDTGDRTPHIYFGNAGALVEATYSGTTAAPNTLSNGTGAWIVGNNATSTRTVDGLYGEHLIFSKVLSSAEMLSITKLSGA